MTTVRLHYWAGARAAAGTEVETWSADSIAEALAAARQSREDPRFARVLSICSVLVDGVVVRSEALDDPLDGPVTVEILPPFAGGSDADHDEDVGQLTPIRQPVARVMDTESRNVNTRLSV